jgi:hypothetical protein
MTSGPTEGFSTDSTQCSTTQELTTTVTAFISLFPTMLAKDLGGSKTSYGTFG